MTETHKKNHLDVLNPNHHKNLLATKTWIEVQEYLKETNRIIIPLGSTEQHGPMGALGVDHLTATAIAYELSDRSGILCAPPLNYGMAIHHLDFSGTIALRPSTYLNLSIDIISSLKRHGFKEFIIINGHGGNKNPFQAALQERIDEFSELEFKFINWWVLPGLQEKIIDKYFKDGEGYHATPTELSLTMALLPGFFKVPENYEPPRIPVSDYDISWIMPKKFRKLYPDGSMKAKCNLASEQIGQEIFKVVIEEILELIKISPN
jgi:creatinine amidohydrolase